MTTTPTSWSGEVTISNFFTDFNPQVSARRDNTFDIVWQRDGGDLVGRHLNELGSFIGGDYLQTLSASTTKELYAPKVFTQPNGQVVVAYSELADPTQGDVRWHAVNEVTPNANSVPTEALSQVDETLLDVTLLESGGSAQIVGLQNVGGAFSPYVGLRFVGPSGTPTSGRIVLDFDSNKVETNASITELQSQDVAVVYEQFDLTTFDRQVVLQIYTQGGVNVRSAVPVSLGGANAAFPDVALLSNGTFVVTWQQADGLAFRTYLANGTPVDATPRLIPDSSGFIPKITALNDGGFIVAWTQIDGKESDGSPELDVYLQRFNAQGNQIGGRIHLDNPGDQSLSSITTLYDGRVIITYGSETGDSTNVTTLKYQIFDPRENTITGSDFNDDNLVGRIDSSVIFGLGGNDRLTGMGANDIIDGGAGNDRLDGGGGNDILTGGLGDDLYVVDSPDDVVRELANEGIDTVRTALTSYTLAANVENLFFLGAVGNLTGIGNASDNRIVTAGGNDVLIGGGGNDLLFGGDGRDIASYAGTASGVTVSLAITGQQNTGGAGLDTLDGIENLIGSSFNDRLTGDAGFNVINGAIGNDVVAGGGGDDILVGGPGNDSLDGGTGIDTASYITAPAAVTVSLAVGTAQNTGGAGIDTLISIENLVGSNFSDTLTGNAGANLLQGMAGNDVLQGGAGSDRIEGGDGNDVLNGGAGNDVLIGGTGTDTATYAGAAAAVTVSLALTAAQDTHGAGTDTLSTIENFIGSSFNDVLTGNNGANRLAGAAGNDILNGGAGTDIFAFTNAGGSDVVQDFQNGTDKLSISGFGAALDTAAEILSHATQVGADVRITLPNQGVAGSSVITLQHFTLANLDASDLIIAA